jgi:hypothetical protein
LTVLAVGILSYAALAALYVALAWTVGRRFGTPRLWAIWLATSLIVAAVAVYRSHLLYDRYGNPVASAAQRWLAVGMGAMFLLAFGFATLSVRKQLVAHPGGSLTLGRLARGIGAFFLGLAVILGVFLVSDVRRLVGQ